MKKVLPLVLLFFLFAFQPTSSFANEEELQFQLESHQKYVGTFSGDIDQKTSVHLVILKDKKAEDFKIKSFFINGENNITPLADVSFQEEPSVFSYHLSPDGRVLSLLLMQEKRRDNRLEIVDFDLENGEVNRNTKPDFESPSLTLRLTDKTVLLNIEDDALEVTQIYSSNKELQRQYTFQGQHQEVLKSIFGAKPEFVNTNEYVENGSISNFKVYYESGRIIFDHKGEKEYTTLLLEPEEDGEMELRTYDLQSLGKVKDISTYIYGGKTFLFINDDKDIHLKSYELESGKLLMDMALLKDFSENLDVDALKDIINTSGRRAMELTGTVNGGMEQAQMVINLDYVRKSEYFYYHNWWWHHGLMQHMMMMQQQQMMQNARMQMIPFGPNPDLYVGDNLFYEKDASLKLVLDENFNLVKEGGTQTQRPNLDRGKYLRPFDKNEDLRRVSVAFTDKTLRTFYYSLNNKSFTLKVFNL